MCTRVPFLLPASLLKIIVAAVVVVTRIVASAPASPLAQIHVAINGKEQRAHVRNEKQLLVFYSNTFLLSSSQYVG